MYWKKFSVEKSLTNKNEKVFLTEIFSYRYHFIDNPTDLIC